MRARSYGGSSSSLAKSIPTLGTWLWTYRPGVDQYAAHRYAAPASATALSATWFGVTSVLLSDGEHSIFIDPFFTRPEGLLNLVLNRKIAPDEAASGAGSQARAWTGSMQ